jgi:hypothetical protein
MGFDTTHGGYVTPDSSETNTKLTLDGEGKQAAAQYLSDQVSQARKYYAKDPGSFASYENDLASRLQKDGMLPDLTLGYAKVNIETLTGSKQGAITEQDLQRLEKLSTDPVTNALLQGLETNLPQFEKEAGSNGKGLTSQDIDKIFLHRQMQSEQEINHALNSVHELPVLKTLLANDEHLLNALETLHTDQTGLTPWQRVTGILDAAHLGFDDHTTGVFLDKVKADSGYTSQFSQKEIDAVKELHQKWNTADVQQLVSGGCIDEGTLADVVTQGKFSLSNYPFAAWLKTGDMFDHHRIKADGID